MSDLQKFEQTHKEHIMQNMKKTPLSIGLENFAHIIGFGRKASSVGDRKNHITTGIDKYENKIIDSRK